MQESQVLFSEICYCSNSCQKIPNFMLDRGTSQKPIEKNTKKRGLKKKKPASDQQKTFLFKKAAILPSRGNFLQPSKPTL